MGSKYLLVDSMKTRIMDDGRIEVLLKNYKEGEPEQDYEYFYLKNLKPLFELMRRCPDSEGDFWREKIEKLLKEANIRRVVLTKEDFTKWFNDKLNTTKIKGIFNGNESEHFLIH